jgi:hypothetical protein
MDPMDNSTATFSPIKASFLLLINFAKEHLTGDDYNYLLRDLFKTDEQGAELKKQWKEMTMELINVALAVIPAPSVMLGETLYDPIEEIKYWLRQFGDSFYDLLFSL